MLLKKIVKYKAGCSDARKTFLDKFLLQNKKAEEKGLQLKIYKIDGMLHQSLSPQNRHIILVFCFSHICPPYTTRAHSCIKLHFIQNKKILERTNLIKVKCKVHVEQSLKWTKTGMDDALIITLQPITIL
jgi:hypothetical protein